MSNFLETFISERQTLLLDIEYILMEDSHFILQ